MYNCPPKRYNMKTPQKYHPSLFSPAVASVPLLPSLSSYRLTNFVYFQHTSDRCLWEGRLSFNAYIWRNLIWTAFCFITISHHCSKKIILLGAVKIVKVPTDSTTEILRTVSFLWILQREHENQEKWFMRFVKCVMHNCTPCVVEGIEIEKCEIRIMMKQW